MTVEGITVLADLVWRWHWEEPGVWQSGESSARTFLGRSVVMGTIEETLCAWLAPWDTQRLRALLEEARKGKAQRMELHMYDAGGRVHRVRIAAVAPTVARQNEVVLAFVILGPAPSSEIFPDSGLELAGHAGDVSYEEKLRRLLWVLRERLGCEGVELQLRGALERELEPLREARKEHQYAAAAVAELLPAPGAEQVEVPLTLQGELLATLRVEGFRPVARPGDERWSAASDVLEALRMTLASWALTRRGELWRKVMEFLRGARRGLLDPQGDSFGELCRAVAAALGADRAHVWSVESSSELYRLVGQWGFGEEEMEALRVLEPPAWAKRALGRSAAFEEGLVFEPPNELDRPGATRQVLFRLEHGGLLFVDWKGRYPGLDDDFAELVCAIASLWFSRAKLAIEADQAARVKADFVATMSHELRTPLNTLMGYTDLLACEEFGPLTAEQRDVLERMNRSARELLELINATLDFGRIQAQDLPLHVEVVSIPELLEELDREIAYARQRRGLSWATKVDPDAIRLQTDREKLKAVLKNLLTNAVKFTERGGVTVTAQRVVGEIEIAVQDTGIGIDPALLPVIFEPFRQGEPASTRRFGGVGLGLYVVRRLVERLGGSVAVESEPTKGSVFRVRIPDAPAVGSRRSDGASMGSVEP